MKLAVALCFAVLSFASIAVDARAASEAPNRFVVTIPSDRATIHVEASYALAGDTVSMFGVAGTPELPDGQASFVRNLTIRDSSGAAVEATPLGDGDWRLGVHDQRISLSYDIAVEHERYDWPAGIEEVLYRTDEGIFFTASALLIVPGDRMEGDSEIELRIPAGWRASTPWTSVGPNRYLAKSRRELVTNCCIVGTHREEVVRVEGFELRLALGRRYASSAALFRRTLEPMLAAYRQVYGAAPLATTYLIVINEGASGDGGAFTTSYSQFIDGDANEANRVVWGYVMAHELCHFWNGLTLVPAGPEGEWFKEGFTDYVTIACLARTGQIDESLLLRRIENVARRYLIARRFQGSTVSLAEAGREKQRNRSLVYGGGSLVALALDVEIRKATSNRKGLDDLMRLMFERYGKTRTPYTVDDVLRAANDVSGSRHDELFAKYVTGTEYLRPEPYLAEAGLRLDSFVEEMYLSRSADATPKARDYFRSMFGRR